MEEKKMSAFQKARMEARQEAEKDLMTTKERVKSRVGSLAGKVEARVKNPGGGFWRIADRAGGSKKGKPFAKFRKWTKNVSNNLDAGGKNNGVLGKDSVLLQQTKGQALSDGSFWMTEKKKKAKPKVKKRVVTVYE